MMLTRNSPRPSIAIVPSTIRMIVLVPIPSMVIFAPVGTIGTEPARGGDVADNSTRKTPFSYCFPTDPRPAIKITAIHPVNRWWRGQGMILWWWRHVHPWIGRVVVCRRRDIGRRNRLRVSRLSGIADSITNNATDCRAEQSRLAIPTNRLTDQGTAARAKDHTINSVFAGIGGGRDGTGQACQHCRPEYS